MRKTLPKRDQVFLRIGAAKKEAGRAFGFVTIRLLGQGLSGHERDVLVCAWWSRDGGRVLSASRDRTLKLRRGQWRLLLTVADHSSYVEGCAWSPDGHRVLSASDDGSVRVFDAQTGLECGPKCWLCKRGGVSLPGRVWPPNRTFYNYDADACRRACGFLA